MGLGPDTSYSSQSKVYTKQQPSGTTINGNAITTEEVSDVGSLQNSYGVQALNGVPLAGKVGFTIVPGAANHTVITIQVQDNGGQPITGYPFDLDVILSDTATGTGVTATTPSGGVAVTTGTQLNIYVASKGFYIQTDATGKAVINIFDTAKTGFYIMVQAGSQPLPAVSRQLLVADYG